MNQCFGRTQPMAHLANIVPININEMQVTQCHFSIHACFTGSVILPRLNQLQGPSATGKNHRTVTLGWSGNLPPSVTFTIRQERFFQRKTTRTARNFPKFTQAYFVNKKFGQRYMNYRRSLVFFVRWLYTTSLPGDSKWPFHHLFRGHLTIEKGHLYNHPKKVTKNCQVCTFFCVSPFCLTFFFSKQL